MVCVLIVRFFVVDKDLWHGELRDGRHNTRALLVHVPTEQSTPEYSVEEAYDNVSSYCLVNSLQSCSSLEELRKSAQGLAKLSTSSLHGLTSSSYCR
jgi:hypothetical protein